MSDSRRLRDDLISDFAFAKAQYNTLAKSHKPHMKFLGLKRLLPYKRDPSLYKHMRVDNFGQLLEKALKDKNLLGERKPLHMTALISSSCETLLAYMHALCTVTKAKP
jgi:hypothetical protein